MKKIKMINLGNYAATFIEEPVVNITIIPLEKPAKNANLAKFLAKAYNLLQAIFIYICQRKKTLILNHFYLVP